MSTKYERAIVFAGELMLVCGALFCQSMLAVPAIADMAAPAPAAAADASAGSTPAGIAPTATTAPAGTTAAGTTAPGETTPPAPVKPTGSPAVLNQLSHWEQQFFTQQYANEEVDKRLGRIEQLVFGAPEKGSDEERIDKLKTALNQPSDGPAVPAGVAEFVKQPVAAPPPPANSAASATPAPATTGATDATGQPSTTANAQSNPAVPSAVTGIADPKDAGASLTKSLNLEDKPIRIAEIHVTKKQFESVLKPQNVIQNLSEAIRDNPKDPELVFQRAKAYLQLDKLDKALADLSDAIETQPNRSDFYLARAWVYHLMGNSVMSDLDLNRARFVDPRFPEKVDWE